MILPTFPRPTRRPVAARATPGSVLMARCRSTVTAATVLARSCAGLVLARSCAAAALVAVVAAVPGVLDAQVFLTQDQALALAFPEGATVERKTAYLTDAQLARARALAGDAVPVEQRIITYYAAHKDGKPVGTAYFDPHRVRTLPEVLMVVVGPDHRVERVEVLKFSEPPDYVAPRGWLDQFLRRKLDDRLSVKGDIVNMTGATLTARAVTDAVRRVLAFHQVVAR